GRRVRVTGALGLGDSESGGAGSAAGVRAGVFGETAGEVVGDGGGGVVVAGGQPHPAAPGDGPGAAADRGEARSAPDQAGELGEQAEVDDLHVDAVVPSAVGIVEGWAGGLVAGAHAEFGEPDDLASPGRAQRADARVGAVRSPVALCPLQPI